MKKCHPISVPNDHSLILRLRPLVLNIPGRELSSPNLSKRSSHKNVIVFNEITPHSFKFSWPCLLNLFSYDKFIIPRINLPILHFIPQSRVSFLRWRVKPCIHYSRCSLIRALEQDVLPFIYYCGGSSVGAATHPLIYFLAPSRRHQMRSARQASPKRRLTPCPPCKLPLNEMMQQFKFNLRALLM